MRFFPFVKDYARNGRRAGNSNRNYDSRNDCARIRAFFAAFRIISVARIVIAVVIVVIYVIATVARIVILAVIIVIARIVVADKYGS